MAYNGSGTFNRIYSWAADKAAGIKITASRMDAEMDGFATGLTKCVTRDGQGRMDTDFVPGSGSNYDLGVAGTNWRNLFLSGGITIGSGDVLDAYEEGTFTPTLYGLTTAGTTTYTEQDGNYRKIGNFVYVTFRLTWSDATGTGRAQIGGLPFNIASGNENRAALVVTYYNGLTLSSGELAGYGNPGSDDIFLLRTSATTVNNNADLQTDLTPTGELYGNMCYIT